MRKRLWLRHKYRDGLCCPLCGLLIKWVHDGISWIPCDEEPVLFIKENSTGGKIPIVKNRELLNGCILYKSGMDLKSVETGLIPHVVTCGELSGKKIYC